MLSEYEQYFSTQWPKTPYSLNIHKQKNIGRRHPEWTYDVQMNKVNYMEYQTCKMQLKTCQIWEQELKSAHLKGPKAESKNKTTKKHQK